MKRASQIVVAVLLFFAVIAAFFYLIIVGIKSDYHPSMTLEEIAEADLSATTVPILLFTSSFFCDILKKYGGELKWELY